MQSEKICWFHVLTVRPWAISWTLSKPYCFHPPHHEIFSLPLWIILTKLFRLSTCNMEKIWWSHVFIFSQWDHEMSHSLLVNLSVFTHPTMRFSHGLMVKWPLLIILTKFFRLSTLNQEKMFWYHGLVVNLTVFTHLTMRFTHGLMVNLTVFTHLTMRFSHGLMVKWPLWIIFTKIFRKSTCDQEKI